MNRIFTFGCSFTEYVWPTWADIILHNNEGFNMGMRGSGFDALLYRLMETDRIFKLNNTDKIIIIFTTPIRWDLIISDDLEWSSHGQITTSELSKYENKLFNVDGLVFKSIYNSKLIKEYLEKRKLNYVIGSINNLYHNYGNYFETLSLNHKTYSLIKEIESEVKLDLIDIHSYLYNIDSWPPTKKWSDIVDYHPRPIQYFNWVNDVLLKNIDIQLKLSYNDVMEIESYIDGLKTMEECEIFFKEKYSDTYNKKMNRKIYL